MSSWLDITALRLVKSPGVPVVLWYDLFLAVPGLMIDVTFLIVSVIIMNQLFAKDFAFWLWNGLHVDMFWSCDWSGIVF